MKKILIFLCFIESFFIFSMENKTASLSVPVFVPQFVEEKNEQSKSLRASLVNIPFTNPFVASEIDPTLKYKELMARERLGVCYNFAMRRILSKSGIDSDMFKVPGCQDWKNFLVFFKNTKTPKKGDLAVYFYITEEGLTRITHYGVVSDPEKMIIKDKWGIVKAVFKHHLFHLPEGYGDSVVCLRLKSEFRVRGVGQDLLIHSISQVEKSDVVREIFLNYESSLLRLAKQPTNEVSHVKFEIFKILEQLPAISLDVKDENGWTPLMWASKKNNEKVVQFLIDYGACKDVQSMNGETALSIAQKNGNQKIQQLLIQ